MRPRDTTEATKAALANLGLLADDRRLADAHNYIEEVPPAQRERDALSSVAAKALAAATAAATARAQRASPLGNKKKRRLAAERAEDYVARARAIRKRSPHLSLNSVRVKLM